MPFLFLLLLVFCSSWSTAASPAGHLETYKRHFSCPFAHLWLEHGAEHAAELLAITPDPPVLKPTDRCALAPSVIGGAHM